MTLEQTSMWLRIASGITIFFGLMVAAAAHPATAFPTVLLADVMIWPLDGAQSGASGEFRLVSAIGGGVMAGWGVALWILSTRGLREAPEMSRQIILTSAFVWFAIDTTGSLVAGGYLNALGNLGFLLMFVLPLRSFQPQTV